MCKNDDRMFGRRLHWRSHADTSTVATLREGGLLLSRVRLSRGIHHPFVRLMMTKRSIVNESFLTWLKIINRHLTFCVAPFLILLRFHFELLYFTIIHMHSPYLAWPYLTSRYLPHLGFLQVVLIYLKLVNRKKSDKTWILILINLNVMPISLALVKDFYHKVGLPFVVSALRR